MTGAAGHCAGSFERGTRSRCAAGFATHAVLVTLAALVGPATSFAQIPLGELAPEGETETGESTEGPPPPSRQAEDDEVPPAPRRAAQATDDELAPSHSRPLGSERMDSPSGEAQPGPEADRGPARVRLEDETKGYYPIVFLSLVLSTSRDQDQDVGEQGFGVAGLVAFPLLPMRPPIRIRRRRFRCPASYGTLYDARTRQTHSGMIADCASGRVGTWYIEREFQLSPVVGVPFAAIPGETSGGRYARQSFFGTYLGLTLRRSRSATVAGVGFSMDLGYQLGRLARDVCRGGTCVREAEFTGAGFRSAMGFTVGRVAIGVDYSFAVPRRLSTGAVHLVGAYGGVHY